MFKICHFILCLLCTAVAVGQVTVRAAGESLPSAVARALEAGGEHPLLVVVDEISIADRQAIPARLDLEIRERGAFRLSDRADLTIGGNVTAPVRQIFYGEGHVRLGRKFAQAEWFGAVGDGTFDPVSLAVTSRHHTPSYHPYRKAAVAVGDSGRVHFGPGTFIMEDVDAATRARFGRERTYEPNVAAIMFFAAFTDGSYETYDYLEVTGEGAGVTSWVSASDAVSGVSYAPYRSRGWTDTAQDLDEQATFGEIAGAGSEVIPLKNAAMAARFRAGDRIYVRQGASVWDQDKGQFSVVERVEGRNLHLEIPLETSFGSADASYAGTVSGFVQPREGGIVRVTYTRASGTSRKKLGGADGTATIGESLYEVVSEDAPFTYTIRNVAGVGNTPAGTAIAAGTPAMKSRMVFPVRATTRGANFAAGTCVGGRDAWILSNYIDCSARDIEMLHRGMDRGGLTINGDGGLNFRMYHCRTRVRDGQFEGSQIARSTTNFHSYDSEWINVKHSIVEFSAGTEFHGDSFVFDATANEKVDVAPAKKRKRDGATNLAAMLIGPTTGGTVFNQCHFDVTGGRLVKAIGTSDIMHYTATAGGLTTFRNTTIEVDGVGTVLSNKSAGLRIEGMEITGTAQTLFGDVGLGPKDQDRIPEGAPSADYMAIIDGLRFSGRLDQIFGGELYAVEVRPNSSVRRLGSATNGNLSADRLQNGSLVTKNGPKSFPVHRVRVELEVSGWPRVKGTDGIKFGGKLNAGDYIRFRHAGAKVYAESKERGFRLEGTEEDAIEELSGN